MRRKAERCFYNRAVLDKEALQDDDSKIEEGMVFALKNKGNNFSIGLSSVLQCIYTAEKRGFVPKLSPEWWSSLSQVYTQREVPFDENLNCGEKMLFTLYTEENTIPIGLSLIVNCLSCAEQQELVPKLPEKWFLA